MTTRAPISTRPLRQSFPRLAGNPQLEGRQLAELEKTLERTRRFCDEWVRPHALEIDRRAGEDPRNFPWELAEAGTKYGLWSMIIPRSSGGVTDRFCTRAALVLEEISAACSGVGTIFGAHALGVSPLLLGGPAFWDGVLREIAVAERRGEPLIMAAALTEPTAGTDYEDPRLMRTARVMSSATKVKGGFKLNGTKHFISNGSVARWIAVLMPTDPKRPAETMSGFVVNAESEGFRVGHVEHKMGQRACPAAELIFEDVFVPNKLVIGRVGDGTSGTMGVLIGSRPVVGAIATGIARGAYERLVEWLINDPEAHRLLDRQQVRLALAQMDEEVHLARQAYLDAATEFDTVSLGRLQALPAMKALGRLPRFTRTNRFARRSFESTAVRGSVVDVIRRAVGDHGLTRALALSSMAKATGADAAMRVTGMALEIAGLASGPIRPELEKLMRDAKLTQIYEGTNQLNRFEAYEGLVMDGTVEMLPPAHASTSNGAGNGRRLTNAAAALASVGARGKEEQR